MNAGKPYNELLELAINAAIAGGKAIMEIYETPFHVKYKEDDSPVTIADEKANAIIVEALQVSGIPVISEEKTAADWDTRKNFSNVWIVDPLDGTKEFIKRNGEFTVNIGLAENKRPSVGVIYMPALRDLYFAAPGIGSYKTNRHEIIALLSESEKINLQKLLSVSEKMPTILSRSKFTIVASRSHLSTQTYRFIENRRQSKGEVALTYAGSSIKMCWIADGVADEYPRFGRTMEWDTCAGQAIVEQAGRHFVNFHTGKPLEYNKEDLSNPDFLVCIEL